MAIAGKVGAVYASDGTAPTAFVDEATTANDDRTRYRVTDADYQYWTPDEAVTVKVNDSPVTTGFTLEHVGGFVVFDDPLGAEDDVTVSGSALTVAQAGGFFNWSLDADSDDMEATTFASEGWKEYLAGLKGWSGSAEAYWGDQPFVDALGEIVVIKLFVDAGESQSCLEGFALISSDGVEVSTSELVQESIDFTGVGPLYPRF